MASPALKAWYAAQEPDPLAVILGRIARLTIRPPPPDGPVQKEFQFTPAPTSSTWRAVLETSAPTSRPARLR